LKRFSSHAHVLQWIDRRVGVPVCFLLTMVRRLGDLFGRRGPAASCRSVLFLKLAEQGSTVLAHEAIRTAVAHVGRENVCFLIFEENRFIVDLLGLIPPGNVLTVRTQSAWSMAASCCRQLIEIRRRRLDACIDLEFFSRSSAAIAYCTGAGRRVGFHAFFGEGPYRGDLLTHRVLYNPHLHTSRTFTSLVLALAADPEKLPTLAIVPPPSPALPLFRLLQEFAGLAVAFTGSPEEAPRIEELVRAVGSPRCICLAGRTTLRQLVVVFGLAEVLVTNDSGPAHFAALTEIDVVSLFGPETPLLFAAPGPRSHTLWAGLACSPCLNAFNNRQTACRDNVCMQRITVDQVFEAVCRIYRQRTENPSAPATADTPTP
jgi:ADP-heptose:LPS heptosyltransferase